MNAFDARGKDPVFSSLIYGIMVLSLLIIAVPFIYVISSSFATEHEIMSRGFFIFPHEWSIEAYGYLLSNADFKTAFGNAVTITVTGTAINILLTSLMAYGLSKSWYARASYDELYGALHDDLRRGDDPNLPGR